MNIVVTREVSVSVDVTDEVIGIANDKAEERFKGLRAAHERDLMSLATLDLPTAELRLRRLARRGPASWEAIARVLLDGLGSDHLRRAAAEAVGVNR